MVDETQEEVRTVCLMLFECKNERKHNSFRLHQVHHSYAHVTNDTLRCNTDQLLKLTF